MDGLPNPELTAYRLAARHYTLTTFNTGALKLALGTQGDFDGDFLQTRWYIQNDKPFANGLPISEDMKKSVAMLDSAELLPTKILDSSGPEIASIFYDLGAADEEQCLVVAGLFGGVPSELESYVALTAINHISIDVNTAKPIEADDVVKKLGTDFIEALSSYSAVAASLWLKHCVDVMYIEDSNNGYCIAKAAPSTQGDFRTPDFRLTYIQKHDLGKQLIPELRCVITRKHISDTGPAEHSLDPSVIARRMSELAIDLVQLGGHA